MRMHGREFAPRASGVKRDPRTSEEPQSGRAVRPSSVTVPAAGSLIAAQRLVGNQAVLNLISRDAGPVAVQRQAVTSRRGGRPASAQSVRIAWKGSTRASLYLYLLAVTVGRESEATRITDLVFADPQTKWYAGGRTVTQQEFDRMRHDDVQLLPSVVEIIQRETGYGPRELEHHRRIGERVASALEPLRGERSLLRGGRPVAELRERRSRASGPSAPLAANMQVLLEDPQVGHLYYLLMEHYGRVPSGFREAAANGLTVEELGRVTMMSAINRHLTELIAQGLHEYRSSGGSSLGRYRTLQTTILDQFTWGNTTAVRNQLKIGHGWPERDIRGIVDRSSGMLLYDGNGMPLRSIAGSMMRDEGWIGAPQSGESWGLDISSIEDPALRGFLNWIRHQTREPARMVATAVRVYLENIDAVNARVRQGLAQDVLSKFEDMLPIFVGFLAGHGLATLLMRSPNPYAAAIGAGLTAALRAAGYLLQIDFLRTAMSRLYEAANYLVRVRTVDDGGLSELSQDTLELAAVPIRQMVVEIAASAAVGTLGRLLRGLSAIRCTRCRISRRQARRRRRRQRGEAERQQLRPRLTRGQLRELKRAFRSRPRVSRVEHRPTSSHREHRGAELHFRHNPQHPNIIRTINRPQRAFVAGNGSWVFYRNGTVVVTRPHRPTDVITAYGSGGRIPQRHLEAFRRGEFGRPMPEARVGDPEPPASLSRLTASGGFGGLASIWP